MSRNALTGLGVALGVLAVIVGVVAKRTYDFAEGVAYYGAGFGGSSYGEASAVGTIEGAKAALLPGVFAFLLLVGCVALLIAAATRKDPVAS